MTVTSVFGASPRALAILLVWAGTNALAAAAAASAEPRHILRDQSAARAALPFSDAVFVGDTLYVSGHLGLDPKTGKAAEDPDTEIRLAMDAVQSTLKASGLTMDDVVAVTVYCTDLALYDKFNSIYRTYFHGAFPTRAFVGVATLLRGGHFEIQAVAVKPAGHP